MVAGSEAALEIVVRHSPEALDAEPLERCAARVDGVEEHRLALPEAVWNEIFRCGSNVQSSTSSDRDSTVPADSLTRPAT